MIVGQVVRLDVLAKRVVNCQIMHTARALLKNKKKVSFLTYCVSSEASSENRSRFASIQIGSVISAQGSSETVDALHATASINNMAILNPSEVSTEVFEPSTEVFTSWTQMEKNKTAEAIVLIVKGILKEKKCILFCSDADKKVYKVFLCTGNHTIKKGDIVLLTHVVIKIDGNPIVYAQHRTTIEINPSIQDKRVLAAQNAVRHEETEVMSVEEIKEIEEDRSIFMKGRIFSVSLSKSMLTIANHVGGVSLKIEKTILLGLIHQITQNTRYNIGKEMHSQLIFYKVLLTADIICVKNTPTIQNPSVTLLME